jgi:ribonuclease BN (tRNA processing enzyme)
VSELRVVLLGTGSTFTNLERAGPAQLVLAGESCVLVDCGDGAYRQLLRAGHEPAGVTDLLFTSLHSDHTLGYGPFVLAGWTRGRNELRVWGPEGTGHFHRQLFGSIYAADIAYQLSLGLSGQGLTDTRLTEIGSGWQGEIGALRVRATDGAHAFPSLAYRFEHGGRSIVISGDTTYTPALVELARGADLLVQDSTVAPCPLLADEQGTQLERRLAAYHSTPAQAGRIAREAGVRTLVLSHLLPGVDPADVAARASAEFDGRVIVGEDLREVPA